MAAQRRKFEEQWNRGLSLTEWAKWRDPAAWAEVGANWVPDLSGELLTPGEEHKQQLHFDAVNRLSARLRADVEGGHIILGVPPDSPSGDIKLVSRDALSELLEAVQFSLVRSDEVYFRGAWIEIRIYRPDRLAAVSQKAIPVGTAKERRGAPAKFAWNEARRELFRIVADGLPKRQATVENKLLEWFNDQYDMEPGVSTIRKFVKDEIGHLWDRRNC